jgi:hypothetical protein
VPTYSHTNRLVGGTGAISYAVQTCYRTIIRAPDGLAAICEDVGTTLDTTMIFPAHTNLFTNNPPGTYLEVLVTPVDSVGVRGPATLYLLPRRSRASAYHSLPAGMLRRSSHAIGVEETRRARGRAATLVT